MKTIDKNDDVANKVTRKTVQSRSVERQSSRSSERLRRLTKLPRYEDDESENGQDSDEEGGEEHGEEPDDPGKMMKKEIRI